MLIQEGLAEYLSADAAKITIDIMKVVKAMAEVFPEYFGDDYIKSVQVDAFDVDQSFSGSELLLLKI